MTELAHNVALVQQKLSILAAEKVRRDKEAFKRYYPDCTKACKNPKSDRKEDHGALCRALYARHMDFFRAGTKHRERMFLAANQIGKTNSAAYEVTCHTTGEYPAWWRGRVFDSPNHWWLAGDTMLTTRNIMQVAMMGPIDNVDTQDWSGMVPCARVIGRPTRRSGSVPLCLDTVKIRHKSGGTSSIQFMSYDQGRRTFQGTARNIWLDEEPPENEDIYGECLTRTITIDGIAILTFTPLRGYTAFLAQYCETATYLDRDGEEKAAAGVFGVASVAE